MLVFRDDAGALLLERRPPSGIWGGLWSFPECAEGAPRPSGLPASANSAQALPGFVHKFTHFDLEILPELHAVGVSSHAAGETERRWVPVADISRLGVPRPVERIVESLESPQSMLREET